MSLGVGGVGRKKCKGWTGFWCDFLKAGECAQRQFLSSCTAGTQNIQSRTPRKEVEISVFYVTFCVNNSLGNVPLVVRIRCFQLILLHISSSFYLMLNIDTHYKFQELHFWSAAVSWIIFSSPPSIIHGETPEALPQNAQQKRHQLSSEGQAAAQWEGQRHLMCGWSSVSSSSVSSPKPPPKTLTLSSTNPVFLLY